MSTPKRVSVYFEPEVYKALQVRTVATHCSKSGCVNGAVRSALVLGGAQISGRDPHQKGRSASFERLAEALKRRRLARYRSRPAHS